MENNAVYLRHAVSQEQIKGEDVVFVHEDLQNLCPNPAVMCKWSLYCVCDGHGGRSAAKYMEENLAREMAKRLPAQCPPPLFTTGWQVWGDKVREAVVDTFLHLDKDFESRGAHAMSSSVGCTVSLALVCGHLLTVANIGDSEAFLDTGRKYIVEMTKSHKIDINVKEQERLKDAGRQVTQLGIDLYRPAEDGERGVGPLRVWPCGLAVSRSLGDYDCGCEVTAAPHIRQVEIPMPGARLILASDGLWDHVTSRQACKQARKSRIHEVPEALIRFAESKSKQGGLTDDTSVLVLDMLPNSRDDFKDVVKKLRGPISAIKRFVRNKDVVKPALLADYDGVEKVDSCPLPASNTPFTRATTYDGEVVPVSLNNGGGDSQVSISTEGEGRQMSLGTDGEDSHELFVLGSNSKQDSLACFGPDANVSKILNPDAIAASESL
ncbi:unnamed protein product [Ostreobium quekettii]|uniref:protein-serine/threonine phosphatase n=1 Tax=Ostreobium quekettii TaxID=121088 RepID=A0A8S1IRZ6_9CHLO|nr:unnamed protein product [Ostreobium quekettii]|eukprot:evm.model.scf_728EXC.3 EVM.evm.TU.scf_728EXC.3   scf_728EXC:21936-25835(+)